MNLDKAIEKVGRAMGIAKFDDAMGGAMLPSGDLSAAGTISVIYGISYEEASNRLNRVMAASYKKKCEQHNKYVKERDRKWTMEQKKKKSPVRSVKKKRNL